MESKRLLNLPLPTLQARFAWRCKSYLPRLAPTHAPFSRISRFHTPLVEILNSLEIGDLVFRAGASLDSKIIMNFSDFKYSHIVLVVNTAPLVLVHATTGAGEDEGVMRIGMDEFLLHSVRFGELGLVF